MPKLQAVLDKEGLEELPEAVREFYHEEEGNFILSIDKTREHPAFKTIKSTADRLSDEKKQIEKKFLSVKPLADAFGDSLPDLSDVDQELLANLPRVFAGEMVISEPGKTPSEVDLDKIRDAAKKTFIKQIDQLQEKNQTLLNRLHSTVRDHELEKALVQANIHKPFLPAVRAMFKERVSVVEDESTGDVSVVIKDDEYGQLPLSSFVKEWVGSDEGKEFVASRFDSGGGAGGSGGGASGGKNPWDPNNWNMSRQAQIYREDPNRAKAMAAKYGHTIGD